MPVRLFALLSLLALVSAACGGGGDDKEKQAASKPCAPAPAAMTDAPKLPSGFPKPSSVTYTGQKAAGPSTIVSGYATGDIGAAFDAWKTAFDGSSFKVTHDEHEAVDAEVNFSGASTSGQVKLLQHCKDRTGVTITVRPQ
jgi:hypothetical protein